jgi:hypothetical protein
MDTVICSSEREEARALPILLRHSHGMVLPNRTYVLGDVAVNGIAQRRCGVPGTGLRQEEILTIERDVETL